MPQYFLGVDVGSSKTHALIADDQGNTLGFGRGGAGNHEGVGYEGLEKALQESTSQALAMAGLTVGQIHGAGFGVAGYDWPSERQPTLRSIATLDLLCPLEAVNDVDIGLIAGTSEGWGLVIDAGSGNNVRGRTPAGRVAGITGCGGRFGEYGGSSELVQRALVAITYAWTHRGPPTRLTPIFMEYVGATDIVDFLEGVGSDRYFLKSEMAPLVFQAAEAGDVVAQYVVTWNSRELGNSAVGIIRQLGFQKLDFEVVLIGSMFNGGSLAIEPMKQVIWEEAPGARFVRLNCEPVVGGVLLGIQTAGLDPRPIHSRLVENSNLLQIR
jgi:N-acetylglucosamine kinase-like BadF-type ATPase